MRQFAGRRAIITTVHRLFLGCPVGAEKAKEVSAWAATELIHARSVPPENLHVTLLFFGSVDEAVRDRLIDLTREAVWEPIVARTGDLAAFGKSALALKLEALPSQVEGIKLRLASEGDPLGKMAAGIASRRDSLRLHLTVARTKSRPPFELSEKRLPPVDLLLDRLVLYESHLGPQGSRYEVLAEGQTALAKL